MEKRMFNRLIALSGAIVLSFVAVMSCGKPEDLTKDVVFSVNNDIIKIPLSLRFYDAKPNTNSGTPVDPATQVPELSIVVTGPDADKIYTSGLQKLVDTQTLKGGLLDIAVKKLQPITSANPIRFTLSVRPKTGNYLPIVKSFTISDTTTRAEEIALLNLDNLPTGVRVTRGTAAATATGTTTATTVNSDSVRVTIPQGTIMKNAAGQVVTGNVEVRLVQFSAAEPTALAAFPGGFEPQQVRDANGTALGAGVFQSAGFIALDMFAGSQQVKTFENGQVQVGFDISPSVKNPQTGQNIRPGDVIPLWSLDERTGDWKKEATLTIGGTVAKPTATWTQSHLSYWNLDWFWGNTCGLGTQIQIPAGFPTGYYQIEFIDATTNWVFKTKWDYLTPGKTVTILNAPAFPSVRIRVTNQPSYWWWAGGCGGNTSSGYMGSSQTFPLCGGGTVPLTFTPAPTTAAANPTITVTAQGYCAANPNIGVGPTLSIWYYDHQCWTWRYLGVMSNGQLSTNALVPGRTYSFWVSSGLGTIFLPNLTVPVVSQVNYQYALPRMLLSPDLCAIIR